MKAFCFTHKDLDGVGCALVLNRYLKDDLKIKDIRTFFYQYNKNLLQSLKWFLQDYEPGDKVFITDIALKNEKEVIEFLKSYDYIWLDHHISSIESKTKFKSSICTTNYCATKITAMYIYDRKNKFIKDIEIFADYVNDFDLGINKYQESTKLHAYTIMMHPENAFKHWQNFENFEDILNSKMLDEIYNVFKLNLQNSCFYAEETFVKLPYKWNNFSIGRTICKHYGCTTFVGRYILERHPEIDILEVINPGFNSISVRSNNPLANCNQYAKQYNGGGHRRASGINLNYNKIKQNMLMFSL